MARTPQQVARENELVSKTAANLISPATSPALTVDERAELAELFEIAV